MSVTPSKLVDYLLHSGYYRAVIDELSGSRKHRDILDTLVFLNNIVNLAELANFDLKKVAQNIHPKQCVLSTIFTTEFTEFLLQNQRLVDAAIDSMVPNVSPGQQALQLSDFYTHRDEPDVLHVY